MSMKIRFSSSSLAFSWLKRSSHSACHWSKASAIVETLRNNGWCWKSQEVSKESQSVLTLFTESLTNKSIFSFFSFSKYTGIRAISPTCVVMVGFNILIHFCDILELRNPKTYNNSSTFGKPLDPFTSKRNPPSQYLPENCALVISDHVIHGFK